RCADDGGADDRGREQDADDGTDGGATPRPVPGGHLILVHVDLAGVVLGDHGGVVGADRADRMQVFDDVVVGSRGALAGVGADVNEYCVGLGHVVSPVVLVASGKTPALGPLR